jgi:limonene-1,2-epoxide hydrolase
MQSSGQIVSSLLDAWRRKAVDEILGYFTDDAVCHAMPMQPLVGKAAIAEGIKMIFSQATVEEFKTLHQLERGEIVMNERLDRFIAGGKRVDLPVMGIFELRGGKIAAWRDYFDAAALVPK